MRVAIVAGPGGGSARRVGGRCPSDRDLPSISFVFTSDAHYGLTRIALPRPRSGRRRTWSTSPWWTPINRVGPLDFVAQGGDLANREEETEAGPIQSATVSWTQFQADYVDGLTTRNSAGRKAPLYIVPGNHEVSNAIGFYKPMRPIVDKTALVEIYNRMMVPPRQRTTATYDYRRDRVMYSHTVGGVHFVFITIWPDSIVRAWLERDLARVDRRRRWSSSRTISRRRRPSTSRIPTALHDINPTDQFENLLAERLADGPTIAAPTIIEQREFERFLEHHSNITAYFHGNSNWNEFYDWNGPLHTVALHTFRVDSPMKGAVSPMTKRGSRFTWRPSRPERRR